MKFAQFIRCFLIFAGTLALAQNPVPFVNQPLVPDAVAPGGSSFSLTVNGGNFVSGATVNWNGSALSTTFVANSQLTANVPAADITTGTTAFVTVTNPTPGGGASNVQFFSVSAPAPEPTFVEYAQAIPGQFGNLVAADLNRDGKLDLIGIGLNSIGDSISAMIGNGDGSFQPPVTYPVGSGPFGTAVADFNGDGIPDLAVTNLGDSTISILLGRGDGTFQTAITIPESDGVGALVTADFDGDGRLDLAFGCGSSQTELCISLGNGDGTFKPFTTYPAGFGGLLVAGDFNGDGKLDLVFAAGDESIENQVMWTSVLLGNGDGTFQPVMVTTFPDDALYNGFYSLFAADINHDGRLDLVPGDGNYLGGALSLLGNGDGTFQAPLYNFGGASPASIAVMDFNADNNLDLAFGDGGSLGIGAGTTGSFTTQPIYGPCCGVVAGDFNADGRMDIAFISLDYNYNNGNYSYVIEVSLQGPVALASVVPAVLTFNPQLPGTTSPAQTVTLNNSGTGALRISNIAFSGPNAGDFAQTNTCGTSLPGNSSCPIKVAYTPAAEGTPSATLTIADSSPGGTQTVALSGTVQDFTVTTDTGPQTVTPGQAANYGVTVSPINDFNQLVTLTCGGAPAHSTCTLTPGSVAPNKQVSVAVVTSAGGMGSLTQPLNRPPDGGLWASRLALSGMLGLTLIGAAGRRRQESLRPLYGLLFLCLLSIGFTLSACGGGGGNGGSSGTPTGTYTLTVTGTYTSASVTLKRTTNLTLVVQ